MLETLSGLDYGALMSWVGSIASILSLILTFFVLRTVQRIREFYLFTARAPELLERLRSHISTLSDSLNDFQGSKDKIDIELTRLHVVLSSLLKKMNGPPRKTVSSGLELLREYQDGPPDQDSLWGVYLAMHKIAAEITDLQEDLKWQR